MISLGSKQAHHATHWFHVHGLAASTGAWLRVTELEISANGPRETTFLRTAL